MPLLALVSVVLLLATSVNADCYLHYFRGSNNRLNEANANRDNANRLFDSQNNNRGGYNCCDLDPIDGFTENSYMADADQMYDWTFLYASNNDNTAEALGTNNDYRKQYEELYFEDSIISVTWTNQHGTGNKKLLSHMILQFGCDNFERPSETDSGSGPEFNINTMVYDGPTTCDDDCKVRYIHIYSMIMIFVL